jgi:spore coat polysaccharide biosynthesis protein SpsF
MINATVEVRMTSSRLPGKPLMKAGGITLLEILVKRLSQSKYIDNIIIATTINKQDDPIVELCKEKGYLFFRGSENNVLERVYQAASIFKTDTLVQITGDCPLIDVNIVDELIELYLQNTSTTRVVSNTGPEISMPWGFDVQVYKAEELGLILNDSPTDDDIEHVSYRFYQPEFQEIYKTMHIKYIGVRNRPELRVTLDYMEDYLLIKQIVEDYGISELLTYTIEDIIKWLDNHPDVRDEVINKHNGN